MDWMSYQPTDQFAPYPQLCSGRYAELIEGRMGNKSTIVQVIPDSESSLLG
jgi:hypothetical protein